MHTCHYCKKPLTEFDLKFYQQLFPNEHNPSSLKCCSCITGKENYKILKSNDNDYKLKLHTQPLILTILWFAAFWLLCLCLGVWFNLFLDGNYPHQAVNIFSTILGILLILLLGYWLYCGKKVVGFWGFQDYDGTPTGNYHYQITINEDGTGKAEKVEETIGGSTGCLAFLLNIILIVTYPLWCVFHLIYIRTRSVDKALKSCPKEVIKAFELARKESSFVKIPAYSVKRYQKEKAAYLQEVTNVSKRYAMLGSDAVAKNTYAIKAPTVEVIINQKKHLIVDYKSFYGDSLVLFLLYKNNANEPEGIAICDNYKTSPCTNWKDEWEKIGLDRNLLKKINEIAKTM